MQANSQFRVVFAIATLSYLFICTRAYPQQRADGSRSLGLNRILVKFRSKVNPNTRANIHAQIGTRTLREYSSVRNLEAVSLSPGIDVSPAIQAYRLRPEVEYVEPDYTVHLLPSPDDPLFPQMWNLLNTGQNGGTPDADVGATLAWNLNTGNHSIVVARLATGIDYNHPDLIPKLFHNTVLCNGVNDGTNGCYGIAPVNNNNNPRGGGGGGGASSSFSLTIQATTDGVAKDVGTVKVTVP